MQWAVRYPEKVSVPLAHELVLSFGKPGFVAGLQAIMDYSYRERLPEIDIPVLVVWGRNDLLVPVTDAYAYAELIGANARVEVFEDTGHVPMLERPSRFNALLRGFLAGEAAPEAGVAEVTGSQS
jgi:pimeloyl-ACP methyl ester carboxylesterase